MVMTVSNVRTVVVGMGSLRGCVVRVTVSVAVRVRGVVVAADRLGAVRVSVVMTVTNTTVGSCIVGMAMAVAVGVRVRVLRLSVRLCLECSGLLESHDLDGQFCLSKIRVAAAPTALAIPT